MEFNKSNILITGGAGFIGSNVAFFLQDNFPNSNIHIFDCFRSGKLSLMEILKVSGIIRT